MAVHTNRSHLNILLWTLVLVALVWAGLGHRMLTRWAYAVERGRIQASSDELAELQAGLPEVQTVSRAFKLVARIARPGVVHIRVRGGERTAAGDSQEQDRIRERLKDMIPEEQLERWLRRVPPGSGSGIIFDADGHILTNNHVVEGREEITVILADDRECEATLVGTDPKTDLAVVKIDAPDLHPLTFGDSDQLEVGDWVVAVGSPFGFTQTVTHGIVSAKGRTRIPGVDILYQDFIQTDAAINPGNSGGPLLSLRGEVVGVNTAIASLTGGIHAGVAFTIPSNLAVKIANRLKTSGVVERGWLGISFTPVQEGDAELFGLPATRGAFVEAVLQASPAAQAGLQVEDVIVALGGVEIASSEQLKTMVADLHPNDVAQLRVVRDRKELTLDVRLGLQPENLGPSGLRQDLRDRARTTRFVESREIARLGFGARTLRQGMLRTYDETQRGVVVWELDRSTENTSDVRLGELVVACNGKSVKSVRELNEALKDVPKDRKVRLEVLEPSGDRRIISVTSP